MARGLMTSSPTTVQLVMLVEDGLGDEEGGEARAGIVTASTRSLESSGTNSSAREMFEILPDGKVLTER